MAAGAITEGSYQQHKTNQGMLETVQLTTAANGEDGVTYPFKGTKILGAFVTGNTDGEGGAFTASWSSTTVTVKSILGATGDATLVSLMVVGY